MLTAELMLDAMLVTVGYEYGTRANEPVRLFFVEIAGNKIDPAHFSEVQQSNWREAVDVQIDADNKADREDHAANERLAEHP